MKTNTVAMILGLVLALFVSVESQAIPIQIFLSQEKVVDPETGGWAYKKLNPTGEAQLIFISGGIQISYKTPQGSVIERKIFENFKMRELDSEEPEFRKRFERMQFQKAKNDGIGLVRNALVSLAEQSQVRQLPLALYFEPKGQAGFQNNNHEFGNVMLLSPMVGEQVSLENFVYNIFRETVFKEVTASFAEANLTKKQPVGFGLPGPAAAAPVDRGICKNIFENTAK